MVHFMSSDVYVHHKYKTHVSNFALSYLFNNDFGHSLWVLWCLNIYIKWFGVIFRENAYSGIFGRQLFQALLMINKINPQF